MFINKKLAFVFAVFYVLCCMFSVCNANSYSDYFGNHYASYTKKLSSYIRKVSEYMDPDYHHNDGPTEVDIVYKPTVDDNENSDTSSCYKELRKCWMKKYDDIPDDTTTRRIVNMLLSRAIVKEEGSVVRRYIVIETSVDEQEALEKFGLGELKYREIDSILNDAMKTPEDSRDYVFIIYTLIIKVLNYLYVHKAIIAVIIIFLTLLKCLCNIKWNIRTISLAIIYVLFTIMFLTSWRNVLQRRKMKGATSGNTQLPIQCQPDKMNWMDKAKSWFNYYDCDKHYKAQTKGFQYEDTPEISLIYLLGEVFAETLISSGTFLYGILDILGRHCSELLLDSFALVVFSTIAFSMIYSLRSHSRACSTIVNFILEFEKNTLGINTSESDKLNKPPAHDKNTYYQISCGTGKSVILKVNAGAKSLEKSDLETKISSVLDKNMEVETILGRISTMGELRITVEMKRKEDKEELIERWQELRDNGVFVEEDIILLDERAKWNMLGSINEEIVKGGNRKIIINGEGWIWDVETKAWVQTNQ